MKRVFVAALIAGACTAMAAAARAEDAGDEPHFPVTSFVVEGAHVLPPATIEATLAPFKGPSETFATLEEAVAALKAVYQREGFSSVAIILPEQKVRDGVIRIVVTEARLGRVTVGGNKHFDNDNILRSLPALVPGQVPNMVEVGTELRLANDNPAKQVQVTMRQGKEADETDAVLRVADQDPLEFAAVIDNTGNATTGRIRLGLAMHEANLFDLDHVVSAQVQTSAEDPSHVFIFGSNYLIPLYASNQTVDFSLGYSNTNSGLVTTTAGSYGITGSGTTFAARLTQFVGRSEALDQRVFEELDYRAYTNDVTLGTSGPSLVPDATVHPLDLGYSLTYRGHSITLDAGLTYVHNIPGGPRGTTADFEMPGGRAGATDDFQMLRYQLTLAWMLPADWQFHAAANGQATRDALIAPEEFGAGGMDSVRGFDERQAVNDRGTRVSVELHSPDAGHRFLGDEWQLRGVAFYDTATLDRNHALPAEVTHETIAAAGLGLRVTHASNFSLRLDFANVLEGAGLRPNHSNMLHASALVAF